MLRNWRWRICVLVLVTLLLAAWVGSYWMRAEIGYGRAGIFFLHAEHGSIYLSYDAPSDEGPGLYLGLRRITWAKEFNPAFAFDFIGFSYGCLPGSWWSVSAPLWLPTGLAGLLLWLVWHKTRSTPVLLAFPVEPLPTPHPAPIKSACRED